MVLCGFVGLSSCRRILCCLYFVCYHCFWRCYVDCVQMSVIGLFSWGFAWFWVGWDLCGNMRAWWLFLMWLMADFDVVMVAKMGRVEAVIWGWYGGWRWWDFVGFWWVLGCFWLGNYCSWSGVLVGILFDYLYLFYGLYWWASVCSVGGLSGFGVVSIALFIWCFVVVCRWTTLGV